MKILQVQVNPLPERALHLPPVTVPAPSNRSLWVLKHSIHESKRLHLKSSNVFPRLQLIPVENHLDFAEQEHSRSGQSTAAPRETLPALALMTAFTLLSTLLISAVRPRQRQKLWKRASCAGVASATHHPANARTQPLAAAARTALGNHGCIRKAYHSE